MIHQLFYYYLVINEIVVSSAVCMYYGDGHFSKANSHTLRSQSRRILSRADGVKPSYCAYLKTFLGFLRTFCPLLSERFYNADRRMAEENVRVPRHQRLHLSRYFRNRKRAIIRMRIMRNLRIRIRKNDYGWRTFDDLQHSALRHSNYFHMPVGDRFHLRQGQYCHSLVHTAAEAYRSGEAVH